MKPTSADDVQGLEFDWIASDERCHVAMFSTAGGGFVPDAVFADAEAHQAAIDAVLALPRTTDVAFAPVLSPDLENTWRDLAERGLYAYDADSFGGPYRLVAAPQNPAKVSELPPLATAVANNVVLRSILLGDEKKLSADKLRQAATGEVVSRL